MVKARLAVALSVLAILVNYLIWGLLDAAGGVKALIEWAGVSSNSFGSWLSGKTCVWLPSEGCSPVPNVFVLLLVATLLLIVLGYILSLLFSALSQEEMENDEKIRRIVLQALEIDRKKRGDEEKRKRSKEGTVSG